MRNNPAAMGTSGGPQARLVDIRLAEQSGLGGGAGEDTALVGPSSSHVQAADLHLDNTGCSSDLSSSSQPNDLIEPTHDQPRSGPDLYRMERLRLMADGHRLKLVQDNEKFAKARYISVWFLAWAVLTRSCLHLDQDQETRIEHFNRDHICNCFYALLLAVHRYMNTACVRWANFAGKYIIRCDYGARNTFLARFEVTLCPVLFRAVNVPRTELELEEWLLSRHKLRSLAASRLPHITKKTGGCPIRGGSRGDAPGLSAFVVSPMPLRQAPVAASGRSMVSELRLSLLSEPSLILTPSGL